MTQIQISLGLVVTTLLVIVSTFLSVVSSIPQSKWKHFVPIKKKNLQNEGEGNGSNSFNITGG
jgi:hypothetical protein